MPNWRENYTLFFHFIERIYHEKRLWTKAEEFRLLPNLCDTITGAYFLEVIIYIIYKDETSASNIKFAYIKLVAKS